MEDCVFCKIIACKIPSQFLHQDDLVVAVRDINPQTPTHILIMPKRHIASLAETTDKDEALLGRMMIVATRLARQEGVEKSGYRLVVNSGPDARQVVQHLHLHVLGGRALGGKMG